MNRVNRVNGWRVWLALLFLASGPVWAHDIERVAPVFVSPADGAVVADLRIPLALWFPREWADRDISLTLDDAPLADPLAVVRNRGRYAGGESDYLSVLELGGLSMGSHTLVATFVGEGVEPQRVISRFEVAPAQARVDFQIRDADGQLRPGRVLVFDEAGKSVNLRGPNFADSDGTHRDKRGFAAFAPRGRGAFRVPAGRYTLLFAGGVLDDVVAMDVALDGPRTIDVTVARAVARPGWLAADLHVHTGRSADSYLPDAFRVESLICAGVDAVVVSDHNHITDAAPVIEQLDLGDRLHAVMGVEARMAAPRPEGSTEKPVSRAHVNVFPVSIEGAQPTQEAPTAVDFFRAWRDRQAQFPHPDVGRALLMQLNHPRGIQIKPTWRIERNYALFDAIGFDPALPIEEHKVDWLVPANWDGIDQPLDFDLLELMNRASPQLYDEVRQDWFGMLNAGMYVTGTGNSDSHTVHAEQAGFPVNLVQVPRPATGDPLDLFGFIDSLHEGRVVVTNGPVVDITVRAGRRVGSSGDVVTTPRRRARITVEVAAASWVPVHEVRLIRNGEVIARVSIAPGHPPIHNERTTGPTRIVATPKPLVLLDHTWNGGPLVADGKAQRGRWTWKVPVSDGDWFIAEAGWPLADPEGRPNGIYGKIAPGHRPIGFTNPVLMNRVSP